MVSASVHLYSYTIKSRTTESFANSHSLHNPFAIFQVPL